MLRHRRRAVLAACASLVALSLAATPATAQEVIGPWHGVLVIGANVLRVVVRVKDDGKGGYQGEMVSPDQSPRPIPLSDVKLASGHFSFAIPVASIGFDGQWDAGHSAWAGQFTQQGVKLPLTLAKGELAPAAAPGAAPGPGPAAPAAKPAASANKTLEGVTVTAQSESAIKTDIDRRSYDITKDLAANSGSIADALRNVPSVQVDVQGNVSLRGDANVTIMIDGKPSSLFSGPAKGQVLQSLPASSFERVEVMTNPSAAFRPDGSAGIINLIPKSARAIGTSGTARVNLGPDGRAVLGVNANSVSKTLTLTGDLVYQHDRQSATLDDHRSTPDPLGVGVLDSMQTTHTDGGVDVVVGRAAFDYDPDAKTRISGELRGTGIDVKQKDASLFSGFAPGELAEGFGRNGLTSLQRINLAATGTWRRKFAGDGHDLVVSVTQERTTDRRNRTDQTDSSTPLLLPSFAEDIRADTTQDVSHLKVDYTRPLAGDAKLKLGYELQVDLDDFDNTGLRGATVATEVPNLSLIDRFRFDQAVNGAYVTYQRPFGDLTVLGGLRIEDTQIDLHDVTSAFKANRDDVNAYPSLHLAYKLSDAQQLTGSFSERIQRPQPGDYNPFRVFVDPFDFRAGNPNLEPQQTYSYEAAYQYRAGAKFFLATAYFRDNDRGVTDVVQNLGGGVLLTTKENLSHSENAGVELVVSGQFLKNLTINFSSNLGWTQIDAADLGFTGRQSAFTPSAQGVVNWQVTPKDLLQVQGVLIGKRLTPQGYHQPTSLVNLGYRHKFNDDWSLFALSRDTLASYDDVLVIDTPALKDRVATHVNLSAVFVGLTYSFGGGRRRDPGFDYGGAGAAPR